jgi:hypothetical protein
MNLFDGRPSPAARAFADAQALIDDGVDAGLVLELFADQAASLRPALDLTGSIIGASAREEASWYFEASLKRKFVDAGIRKAAGTSPVYAPPAGTWSRARAAAAGMAVAAGAAAAGVVAFGFLTAGDASPDDWRYAFKLTRERMDSTLSTGDGKVDVQLRQAEARVQEIITLSSERKDVPVESLQRLNNEAQQLAQAAQTRELDAAQKERLLALGDAAVAVLNSVSERQPALKPAAEEVVEQVYVAVAAGLGRPTTPLQTPAQPSPVPAATPTPTPEPSPSAATDPASPAVGSETPPSATATPTPGN